MNSSGAGSDVPDDIETLRLVYQDMVGERDRLRDARQSVTRQLGPLPAASAILVGLFGAFSDISGAWPTILYVAALAIFGLIALLSGRAITRKSYRHRRAEALSGRASHDGASEAEWLRAMIQLDRELFGPVGEDFDAERRSLLMIQTLAFAQIILLGLIPVVSRAHIS